MSPEPAGRSARPRARSSPCPCGPSAPRTSRRILWSSLKGAQHKLRARTGRAMAGARQAQKRLENAPAGRGARSTTMRLPHTTQTWERRGGHAPQGSEGQWPRGRAGPAMSPPPARPVPQPHRSASLGKAQPQASSCFLKGSPRANSTRETLCDSHTILRY